MSIHVMSRGAMFRFIKKCECIKKKKGKKRKEKLCERESDVNTHAIYIYVCVLKKRWQRTVNIHLSNLYVQRCVR